MEEENMTESSETQSSAKEASLDEARKEAEELNIHSTLSTSPDKEKKTEMMSEEERQKIISEALRQEDEFLEYIMSVPGIAEELKEQKTVEKPPLARSISAASGVMSGMDHLERLCTLMEQLGDLKVQNSRLQRRVQYLEDLKGLQDMHKELQRGTRQRQLMNQRLLRSLIDEQECRRMVSAVQRRRKKDNGGNLTDSCVLDVVESDESVTNRKGGKLRMKTNGKTKLSKSKASLGSRERSKSIGIDELETNIIKNRSKNQEKSHQRRSLAVVGSSTGKAKVSKWTKVKEAFRWEKASTSVLHDSKSTDSGLGGITEDNRYLKVPSLTADAKSEHCISVSPTDSVLSGHSSSMCSSGGHSHSHKVEDFILPPLDTFSSSSSSEDIDLELRFSNVSDLGPRRSASASDSRCGRTIRRHEVRRLSRCLEEDASRRSKSLDGDTTNIAKHFAGKDGLSKMQQGKPHKTPWGKVKDIIQTRKDSLKKKHRKGTEQSATAASSDHEDEMDMQDGVTDDEFQDNMEKGTFMKHSFDDTCSNKRQHCKVSTGSLGSQPTGNEFPPSSRRLTPTLTITLPSTEELRPISNRPPPSPQTERRPLPLPEDRQVFHSRSSQAIIGTSPPDHRRSASKWTKVKKAFLTSAPGRRDEDPSVSRGSNSGPSSPNRNSSFLYDVDPDELSSGEFAEVNSEIADDSAAQSPSAAPDIHEEIQRNYKELQQKLSLEFHQKLLEWERIKASSNISSSPSSASRATGSSVCTEEPLPHHDKHFRRKMEEWERIKQQPQQSTSPPKYRDSAVLQLLGEDNLSPDFRKKLQEWERIKALPIGERVSPPPSSAASTHHKKKIAEWQLWRTGSNKSDGACSRGNEDHGDDFNRKVQQWERTKPNSETQEQSDSGVKTPSPGVVRKNSGGSSGSKSGSGGGTKSHHHKSKSQKEKELQWLDKELQKIEREKIRLEREREKYLEREARLEKMRRAVGSAPKEQEILIQTSTGFFRFEGISEKFTKRLYEWEQAKGIGPEASTFVFLDPQYKPPSDKVVIVTEKDVEEHADGSLILRSKSTSSVTTLGVNGVTAGVSSITHQPSSLSLNDVDTLEQLDAGASALEDTRSSSEPHLRTSADEIQDDEPSAVIVDVEDVIEETAAPLPEQCSVEGHTPVYCYAPIEVTQLMDSDNTESSYKLLEENIHLLKKLCDKEDLCRKLENEIEHLEGQIDDVTKTHDEELQRLRKEEEDYQLESSGNNGQLVQTLRSRVQELEKCQESLRQEGATLKDSFKHHSEQQAAIAQNLVGKIKELQEVNNNIGVNEKSPDAQMETEGGQDMVIAKVQNLSSELLFLAEALEKDLAERNMEIRDLRSELRDRKRTPIPRFRAGHLWYSEDGISVSSLNTDDLNEAAKYKDVSRILVHIPSQLTQKVQELKEELTCLCSISSGRDIQGKLEPCTEDHLTESDKEDNNTYESNSHGDISPVSVTITPAFLKRKERCAMETTFDVKSDRNVEFNYTELNLKQKPHRGEESLMQRKARESTEFQTAKQVLEDSKIISVDCSSANHNEKTAEEEKIYDLKTYETEVSDKSVYRKQKKILKTRRISDTHVGYKTGESSTSRSIQRRKKDVSPVESEEEEKSILDRRPIYRRSVSKENHEEKNERRDEEKKPRIKDVKPIRVEDVAAMISEDPIVKSRTAFLIHNAHSSGGMRATNSSPVSVFVPTTRKVFSPICYDIRGKSSSAISYVVSAPVDSATETSIKTVEEQNGIPEKTFTMYEENVPQCTDVDVEVVPNIILKRSRSKSTSPSSKCEQQDDLKVNVNNKDILETISNEKCTTESCENVASENSEDQKLSSVFPPPPSPNPSKRDLYKAISKETAPSIRLMIAKYNQKLNEQENGTGGKSPEITGSGPGSPVAWRSPATERRIRVQMEKYQEEVRRVLEKGIKRREVQKSASAGVIRTVDTSSDRIKDLSSNDQINKKCENKPSSPATQPRGILKSSSVGTIKSTASPGAVVRLVPFEPAVSETISEKNCEVIRSNLLSSKRIQEKPPALRLNISIPSSPEMGKNVNQESPPSRVRAQKLKKAKEDFLSRGPAGQSWTSDLMTSTSTTSEAPSWSDVSRKQSTEEATNSGAQSRLSMDSECSYDDSAVVSEQEDGVLLVKSASAGMINVEPTVIRKLSSQHSETSEPVSSDGRRKSKFGISSLASRFRKVKMRKSKEKDTTKMGAVTTLCRQSLLVDLHLSKRASSSRIADSERPSTSKSCPSSPVLRRSTSNTRMETEERPVSSTWIKNPAKRIFKSK